MRKSELLQRHLNGKSNELRFLVPHGSSAQFYHYHMTAPRYKLICAALKNTHTCIACASISGAVHYGLAERANDSYVVLQQTIRCGQFS
jgi:hypothetical protein